MPVRRADRLASGSSDRVSLAASVPPAQMAVVQAELELCSLSLKLPYVRTVSKGAEQVIHNKSHGLIQTRGQVHMADHCFSSCHTPHLPCHRY